MNDILRWAKEADLWMTSDERIAAVERFAALVRADEREAIIDIVAMHGGSVEIEAAIRTRKES
jgi:hypothetical protein